MIEYFSFLLSLFYFIQPDSKFAASKYGLKAKNRFRPIDKFKNHKVIYCKIKWLKRIEPRIMWKYVLFRTVAIRIEISASMSIYLKSFENKETIRSN